VKAKLDQAGLDSSDSYLVLATVDRVPDGGAMRTEAGKPRHAEWKDREPRGFDAREA
jgi:hypothetical protein